MRFIKVLTVILIAFTIAPGVLTAKEIIQPHVTAELISEEIGLTPGVDASFALRLTPDKDWHLYWKYPGDSGSAPILQWEINGQSVDAEVQWPTPEVIPVGPFVNYGYSAETLLITTLPIPYSVNTDVEVVLDAEWLVCKEECIPGNGLFKLKLPVFTEELPPPSKHAKKFRETRKRFPLSDPDLGITSIKIDNDLLSVTINDPEPSPKTFRFIPESGGLIENSGEQTLSSNGNQHTLSIPLRANKTFNSPEIQGVLLRDPPWKKGAESKSIALSLPAIVANTLTPPATQEMNSSAFPSLAILAAAFLGGLILNLMPCVFPVLSIKILSFVKKAGKEPQEVRKHGIAFGAGIIVSFWALAITVRTLRSAGEQLGWGFQLQNPSFVALLILLLTAVAMNFFGAYEFGSSIQKNAGAIGENEEGYLGTFLSGVLATVLATPCTAPFMGSALAYGLSAALFPSLIIFTSLALGLATPYLVLSFFPVLLSRLPKPGEWMNTIRQFMAFPVLLTAVWLLWVFEKQSDSAALFNLLLAVLLLSFALWIYGKVCPPCSSRKRQAYSLVFIILSLASCTWLGVPTDSKGPSGESTVQMNGDFKVYVDKYNLSWYVYSPDVIDKLLDSGRPIYVDFTAAWCVTCQLNKRLVFSSDVVTRKMKEKDVALVRGDWTNEDGLITAALRQHGRAGVPLNLLYNPEKRDDPFVFPAVLTPQIVMDELKKLPE